MSESLPERTKQETAAPEAPQSASTAPSKNALKKAAKEKEKAEKAAKRAAEEQKAAAAAAANDISKHLYGKTDSNPKEEPTESMPETTLEELTTGDHDGEDVMIEANVDNARVQSAKLGFLVLRQELDTIQAVIAESPGLISRQMVKWASNINRESVVRVYGKVQKAPEPVNSATISNFELHIQRIYLVAEAAQKLPLQIKDVMSTPLDAEEGSTQSSGDPNVTLYTRLNHRVLDLRTPRSYAIGSISHTAEKLFREYMDSHGAKEIITPKIMGAATEGGGNVFEMNYFGGKAYLAQSPQLHKQMLISSGRRKVFEVGTVFRAENSNTHRHLTEFTGLDFECRILHHYHEVLAFAEDLLVYMIKGLQTRCKREIAVFQADNPKAGDFRLPTDGKVVRLNYMDGVKILKDTGEDVTKLESFETDFSTAQEQRLGKLMREKYGTDFYVLDKFPMAVRPFYTMPCPNDPNLSNSYDFFMRGEEIMSGAQRIHEPELLIQQMKKKDPPLDPEAAGFKDYVDAFRYGCPPHAGGGLGLNRIVQFFLGLKDVREATFFPRDPGRLAP